MTDLSRRRLLGGGLAALSVITGGGVLTACGVGTEESPTDTAADTDPGAAPPTGPWRYTDGYGQDLELESTPTRIAAFGDQAVALLNFGITPVALFHQSDPATDSPFEGVDLSGIEIVGTAYGEIDVERLAALAPDLIVTTGYEFDAPDLPFGFKDESQVTTIREIAPIAGVLQSGSALDVIRANEKLVASLGVDVEGGRVAEDRAEFEAAAEELRSAARSGLVVAPVYAEEAAGLWFAKATDDPALTYYAELGVRYVQPGGEEYYWEQVSWENADRYPSDVVVYSVRNSLTPEQLMDQPTFASRDAAQADQLHPWKFKSMDYVAQAANMREIAGWLTEDRQVL